MPGNEPDRSGRSLGAPTAMSTASPRELRAQSLKRLQVGLFGLAAMLLLVALANIINDRVRRSNAGAASSVASAGSAADPLADLGVIPSPDAAGTRKRPGTH